MNIVGKKFMSVILAALTFTSTASAGDREWAVAGKVLTGVAAITVIDRIVNPPQPVVVYSQPVVVAQPVVVQPTPVVVVPQPTVVYIQPAPVVYFRPVYYPHYHHRGWR